MLSAAGACPPRRAEGEQAPPPSFFENLACRRAPRETALAADAVDVDAAELAAIVIDAVAGELERKRRRGVERGDAGGVVIAAAVARDAVERGRVASDRVEPFA